MFASLKTDNKAFSIVEVTVVVAILVTVNTMIFLSNRSVGTSRSVDMAAYRMLSEARQMQSHSLNLQKFGTAYPGGGWGIFFDKRSGKESSYFSFADLGANHLFDTAELNEKIDLPGGIKIKDIVFFDGNTTSHPDYVSLSFEPPEAKTYICTAACNGVSLEIILSDSSGTIENKVYINRFGLLETY